MRRSSLPRQSETTPKATGTRLSVVLFVLVALVALAIIPPHQQVRAAEDESKESEGPTYRVGDLIKSGKLQDWELEGFRRVRSIISLQGVDDQRGTARTTFQGPDGYYKVRIQYVDEDDGVSRVTLAVGDREVGTWRFDGTTGYTRRWKEFDGVRIKHGDVISLKGRMNHYEYCRMAGVEILPSEKQASASAAPVQPREFSQDLVPLAAHRDLALDTSTRMLPLQPIFTGSRGNYLLHLDEGQRFHLVALPRYSSRDAGVQYALTPKGADEPVQAETLRSESAQPLHLWLEAEQAGLYVLNVQSPPNHDADVKVRFEVPAVYPLDQPDPQLRGSGFFFVPKGTKAVGVNITGRAILLDTAGNVMLDEWISDKKETRVEVPEGSDDQLWYYQGNLRDLVGVPRYVSQRPEAMLVPRETLGSPSDEQ